MAEKTEFLQAIDDAVLDADSLEQFINGSDSETVLTRLSAEYPTLQKALKELFENGGIADRFKTLADLQASSLVDGDYALVADDAGSKNGIYIKNNGEWVKSKYDPTAVFESIVSISDSNKDDIIRINDANASTVYRATKDGKHYFVGLKDDLQTALEKHAETSASQRIFEIADANGNTTLAQDANGDVILPVIGNLTQTLARLEKESVKTVDKSGVLLPLRTIQESGIVSNHAVDQLRIPALTRISKNEYILFFEARSRDVSGGEHLDFAPISCGSCRVTIDIDTLEPTISDINILGEAFTDSEGKLRTFMNPCGVLLGNGDIIVTYARRYAGTGDWTTTSEHETYVRKSTDGGVTWQSAVDISGMRNGLNLVAGMSQGMVKQFGSDKGRIIFPAFTSGNTYVTSEFRSGYFYSDDNGSTWQIGGWINTPTSNEVQAVEDMFGNIYFACRLESRTNGLTKELHKLQDGTLDNFEKIDTNMPLSNYPVMSALIRNNNEFDGGEPFYMLTTCIDSGRRGLSIKTSYDMYNWHDYVDASMIDVSVNYTAVENISQNLKLVVHEDYSFYYHIISTNAIKGVS